MNSYENSFDSGDDGGLVALMSAYYRWDWTPHDADVVCELVAWSVSWGLRLGGLVLLLVPPLTPWIPAMMKAGDTSDRVGAVIRIGITTFWTLPDILGAQFDVMRACSLGYQAVFLGQDSAGALLDDREAAFG
jgi:hypothetical protein